jgi:hypothetical protein
LFARVPSFRCGEVFSRTTSDVERYSQMWRDILRLLQMWRDILRHPTNNPKNKDFKLRCGEIFPDR